MTVYTNGGSLTTTRKGTLEGYGKVWYHPDAITNILCMSNVKKLYRVTFDSEGVDRFTIHKPGRQVNFDCSEKGLYYHDFDNCNITLVNTVQENRQGYTNR